MKQTIFTALEMEREYWVQRRNKLAIDIGTTQALMTSACEVISRLENIIDENKHLESDIKGGPVG